MGVNTQVKEAQNGIFDGTQCVLDGVDLEIFQKSTEINIHVPKPLDSKDALFVLVGKSGSWLCMLCFVCPISHGIRFCPPAHRGRCIPSRRGLDVTTLAHFWRGNFQRDILRNRVLPQASAQTVQLTCKAAGQQSPVCARICIILYTGIHGCMGTQVCNVKAAV